MKNYTRIILILFAALCICSCGIRSQKNASREADTGPVDADYFIELTGHHPGRGETELPGDTSTDGEYDTVGDVSYPPYPSEVVRTEDADIDLFELAREESAGPPIFIVSDMIEIIPDIMEVVSADMVADAMIVGSRPSSRSSSRSASGGVGGHRADIQSRPGTITAGEWNDLDNWSFWQKVSAREEFVRFPGYWEFYCGNRVSVAVESPDGRPVVDAGVRLLRGDAVLYSARTDNRGRVELWVGLNKKKNSVDYRAISLEEDG
ncbi:MAG: hypothetical protein LIO77_06275 [Rikenellaceae bacterium]|nr:hypothetical protein [Rikenellaceae bacterium]